MEKDNQILSLQLENVELKEKYIEHLEYSKSICKEYIQLLKEREKPIFTEEEKNELFKLLHTKMEGYFLELRNCNDDEDIREAITRKIDKICKFMNKVKKL